jgi:hypothetical protein
MTSRSQTVHPSRALRCLLQLLAVAGGIGDAGAARAARELALAHFALDLPGAPASIITADLDGDGRRDLAVVLVYSGWNEIATSEQAKMDGVDGLVEVMTVIPELADHRELRLYRGLASGGFEPWGEPLPLAVDVLSLATLSDSGPLVALTDAGISLLAVGPTAAVLAPVLADPPLLAGTETFLPDLPFVRDLDGDGRGDVLVPAAEGVHVHRALSVADAVAFDGAPTATLAYPPAPPKGPRAATVPLAEVRDLDGDGRPEVVLGAADADGAFALHRNLGDGHFAGPLAPDLTPHVATAKTAAVGEVVWVGDLDGDGRAEVARQQEHELPDDSGMRAELAAAKSPDFTYRLYRGVDAASGALEVATAPYATFDAKGYSFAGDTSIPVSSGFQDLDGDGRQDLVALTLDFSLFQAMKMLTVQRITLGIDFHVYCQQPDGRFRAVSGLDLSGKFKLALRNLELGALAQFAGDFDGDGRADYVQMGRGKKVGIHRGGAGCTYPSKPDLVVELDEEPADLSLVQVRDLDGDRRADLAITQTRKLAPAETGEGASLPVRLDLYLSGGAR